MAFYDKFPYSNFHELNTDWIIQKIKSVADSEAHTEELAEQAAASASASDQSAQASAASAEAAADSAEAAAGSETAAAESAAGIEAAREQIYVNTQRLNNLIVDGQQTEGNTELLDIRVGYDGTIYDTAGNAVRDQVSDLNQDATIAAKEYTSISLTGKISETGSISTSGELNPSTTAMLHSDFIKVMKGWLIDYSNLRGGSSYNLISFYSDRLETNYLSGIAGSGASSPVSGQIAAPSDGYVRFCTRASDIATVTVTMAPVLYKEINSLSYLGADITNKINIPGAPAYLMTPYIFVAAGWQVNYKNMRAGSGNPFLWFFDTALTLKDTVNGSGSSNPVSGTFLVPEDGYIAIATRQPEIAQTRLSISNNAIPIKVKYVATNGNDSNTGDSSDSPYATIAKALIDGANIINLAPGTYTETISNPSLIFPLKIYGYGATFAPTVSANCIELRDREVEIYGITVDMEDTSDGSGIFLRNCTAKLVDCTVRNTKYMGFRLDGSKTTLIRCTADNCGKIDGETIVGDGFNAHDTTANNSEGLFIDCVAINCKDDGLSYHEEGIIHVMGGEYASNGSTGIAPHNNCNCDIHNAYIHDNDRAGIEALVGDYTTPNPLPTMVLTGCIFEDNTGNAVTAEHFIVKACANGASGNGANSIVNGGSADITTFTLMS